MSTALMPNRNERTILLDFGIFAFLIGVTILATGIFLVSTIGFAFLALWVVGIAIMFISFEMIAKFSKREAIL